LADIARVVAIWTELRQDHAKLGPWLLGQRSIADAFYTPVATRFRSYGVALPAAAAAYADTLLADADFRAWEADAIPDSWDVSGYSVIDRLYV
jgi:glutathione S-transferase